MRATERLPVQSAVSEVRARSPYLVSANYDRLFFLFGPLLGLAIYYCLFRVEQTPTGTAVYSRGVDIVWVGIAANVITQAHIFLVVFRSHLNPQIFAQSKLRFTLVPAVVFIAMLWSDFIFVTVVVLAKLWDIYHTSKQTFGIARLYDNREGNPSDLGRNLDLWLNHVLYIGPILAGINLLPNLQPLGHYHGHSEILESIPALARSYQGEICRLTLTAGFLFSAYYLFADWKLYRRGYKVSRPKVILLITNGATSLFAWGFQPFLVANLVTNFAHAVQYFGIVWWAEKKGFMQRTRLSERRNGVWLAGVIMFGTAVLYGCLFHPLQTFKWGFALTNVFSIMHFWYDGFIWSIRKKQITA